MTTQPTPEAGADLLDRMAEALRTAKKHIGCGTDPQTPQAKAYWQADAIIAEYDRLHTQATGASVGVCKVVGVVNLTDMAAFFRESAWLRVKSADEIREFAAEQLDKLASCGIDHTAPLTGEAGRTEECSHCQGAGCPYCHGRGEHYAAGRTDAPVAWQYQMFDIQEMEWSEYWHQCTELDAARYRGNEYQDRVKVRDLYAAPRAAVNPGATDAKVSDAMVRALMVRLYPGVFQKTESESYDRLFPIVRKALEDTLAATQAPSGSDEGGVR